MMDAYWKTPSLRRRYLNRLSEVLTETFTEKKLYPRIDQLTEILKAVGDADLKRWGEMRRTRNWQVAVKEVKSYVKNRRAFLQKELKRAR
ncbi:MAG: hypothetical protein ACI8T1_005047 [Verrucomicrobiales bacterium]|jgi:hypothetical protein